MLSCFLSPLNVVFFLVKFFSALLKNNKYRIWVFLSLFFFHKKTLRKSTGFVCERQVDCTENGADQSYIFSSFFFFCDPRLFRRHLSVCLSVSWLNCTIPFFFDLISSQCSSLLLPRDTFDNGLLKRFELPSYLSDLCMHRLSFCGEGKSLGWQKSVDCMYLYYKWLKRSRCLLN